MLYGNVKTCSGTGRNLVGLIERIHLMLSGVGPGSFGGGVSGMEYDLTIGSYVGSNSLHSHSQK